MISITSEEKKGKSSLMIETNSYSCRKSMSWLVSVLPVCRAIDQKNRISTNCQVHAILSTTVTIPVIITIIITLIIIVITIIIIIIIIVITVITNFSLPVTSNLAVEVVGGPN